MSNTKIKASQFHGVVGHGTDGYFLMTNADGSMSWSQASTGPSVTSVAYPGDDTAADPAGGQTVVLTGTGFAASGMTVSIGGTTAPSVAHDSNTQLTITTPAKAAGDYDIVVTNTVTGASGTFVNGISYNGVPTWTTAAGSLGTFESETTISTITLQATEPDGGTITFNITNGALPTGLSLTGANIDGTTTAESSTTLYSFTIEAIDDENQSTPRNFSITVNAAELISSENFTINTYTGNGSTQSIEGKIGTAAEFNGSSSNITTPFNISNIVSNINDRTQDFSISLWINPFVIPSSGNDVIFYVGNYNVYSPQYHAILLKLQNGNTIFTVYDGVEYNASTSSVTINNWYHISCVRESSVLKLYVNGSLVDSVTQSGDTAISSSATLKIGQTYSASDHYNGKLDQVRLFNKALSSSEVTTLYGESNTSTTKSTTDIFADGSGVALYEFEKGAIDTGGTSGYIGGGGIFANPTGNKIGHSISLGTNFSISFWINSSSYANTYYQNTTGDIIGFGGDNANGIWISTYNGKFSLLRGSTSGGQAISTNTNIPVNTWAHVVVTYSNGNTTSFYVNGSAAGTYNHTTTSTNTGIGIFSYIGDSDYPTKSIKSSFVGKLDQLRIFNKALSSSEVTTLYGETSASATKSTTDIFDDGSGVALYELEGNARDTGRGAIDSGQSAVFNGIDSNLHLGGLKTDETILSATSFSVSMRVNFNNFNAVQNIIGTIDAFTHQIGWTLGIGTDSKFYVLNDNDNTGTWYMYKVFDLIPSANTWYHLAFVSNGSNNDLYINGSLVQSTIVIGSQLPLQSSSTDLEISINSTPGRIINGKIDQVRIYNTALSPSDVANLVSETNVPTANLVAHYKLDGNALDETTNYNGTATSLTYSDPAEFPTYDGTATNVSYAYDGTPTNVSFVGTSFQPDLVWIKERSNTSWHILTDSVRGTNKTIYSNDTYQEESLTNVMNSFDTNGFTVAHNASYSSVFANRNNETYVAWSWKAGGAAVSNTDGTITSTVSANQDAGFSIVKQTSNNTNDTYGHGLLQAPELIISKNMDVSGPWGVYHKDLGTGKWLYFNTTASVGTSVNVYPIVNDTVFSGGSEGWNNLTYNYINYCFHSVDGYQKVGSYTGTNATNAVTTGFEPRFLMVKLTSAIDGQWVMYDNVRSSNNPRTKKLAANASIVENDSSSLGGDSVHQVNFTSTGFELLETSGGVNTNKLNETYIYLAIA